MRKVEGVAFGKRVPRSLAGAALVVAWLVAGAPAALCRAEPAPDKAATTQGAEKAPGGQPKPASPARDKIVAIQNGISRTITSHENDIRDAYYRELTRNPAIAGEITVSFTVQPAGDVADLQVANSSLNWPPLEEEILKRVATWKFPPFEGTPVPATVPYKFTPK